MKCRLALPLLWFAAGALAQISEVEITAEPHHHLAFQNHYVRVFKVEVPPHQSTLLHRHRHDYVFVTLGAAEVENDVVDQRPRTLKLQDGETRFTPGGFAHIAKNSTDAPFRNVTIEFLRNAQDGKVPRWGEERGLHILEGGTQDILFVKDGVRVSDIQLQPGARIPVDGRPSLVVALSNLDLKSRAKSKSMKPIQLKTGEITWISAGPPHVLINMSQTSARLITLEFP